MRFQACLFAFLLGFAVCTAAYVTPADAQNTIYNSQSQSGDSGSSSKKGLFSLFNKKKDSGGSKPIYLDPSKPSQQGNNPSASKSNQPYEYGFQHKKVSNSTSEFSKALEATAAQQDAEAAQSAAENAKYVQAQMASYEATVYQQRMKNMQSKGVGSTGGSISGGSKGNVTYKVKEPRKTNAPIRLFNSQY